MKTRLPEWLQTLVSAAADVQAQDLTRVVTPADARGRHSAVLILFAGDRLDDADVLLLQRAATLRSHAGQVAFPGGATDPGDASPAATALREAAEEVGLAPESAVILGELPLLYLPPSGFLVTPVLAHWLAPHPVGPVDAGEVAKVARVRLADLLEPSNRFTVRHPSGYVGPGFAVDELFVWGFTAGLLSGLLRLGGFERPWDADLLRPVPS